MTFERSLTAKAGRAVLGVVANKYESKKQERAAAKKQKREAPTLLNGVRALTSSAWSARPSGKARCAVCTDRKAVNDNGTCDLPRCVNLAGKML